MNTATTRLLRHRQAVVVADGPKNIHELRTQRLSRFFIVSFIFVIILVVRKSCMLYHARTKSE